MVIHPKASRGTPLRLVPSVVRTAVLSAFADTAMATAATVAALSLAGLRPARLHS